MTQVNIEFVQNNKNNEVINKVINKDPPYNHNFGIHPREGIEHCDDNQAIVIKQNADELLEQGIYTDIR